MSASSVCSADGAIVIRAIRAFHFRDANMVSCVPHALTGLLRLLMFLVSLPGENRRLVTPVTHSDAKPVHTTRTLDAEESVAARSEFDHPLRHFIIAMVSLRPSRWELDCIVRRLRRGRGVRGSSLEMGGVRTSID